MAERYAVSGVDESQIVTKLEEEGMTVIVHEREYHARLPPVAFLMRLIGRPGTFSIIARKDVGQ